MAGPKEASGTIKIHMHLAADSRGKVVWPEIHVGGREVKDIGTLKEMLGEGAAVAWSLRTWAGSATRLPAGDPRIEQEGFLLRLGDDAVRSGMRAECVVMA